MDISSLKTGDIILITDESNGFFNNFLNLIKYFTHSNITHIAIVLKDPSFLEKPLKGTYIWESGFEGTPDPQDNKIKLGVQVTEINQFLKNYNNGRFFVRRLENNKVFTEEKLKEIHNKVYDVPYDIDIFDWIYAFFRKDNNPQKVTRFWCSAFVGYIFVKCGVLKETCDWSILYPNDFSLSGEKLDYKSNNKLKLKEIELKI